jgi:hypothetical protein
MQESMVKEVEFLNSCIDIQKKDFDEMQNSFRSKLIAQQVMFNALAKNFILKYSFNLIGVQ